MTTAKTELNIRVDYKMNHDELQSAIIFTRSMLEHSTAGSKHYNRLFEQLHELLNIQKSRAGMVITEQDSWFDKITELLDSFCKTQYTKEEIATYLGIQKPTLSELRKISAIMHSLGWESMKVMNDRQQIINVFHRPNTIEPRR